MNDSLAAWAVRLSVQIGGRAAQIHDATARDAIFADAHDGLVQDLLVHGHHIQESTAIADDIIDGARKVVADLTAYA